MKNNTYFITGISTEVGKTIVSAIITEALEADYWKPIQAGELDASDTRKVRQLVSNTKTKYHPTAFNLETPMSPHAAAEIDGVALSVSKIDRPVTTNNLVIEGAGGLLVPLNSTETVSDLIKPTDRIVVVSRHYLGSINHTLLTLNSLAQKGLKVYGIIFSGKEHPTTERVIRQMTEVPILGRINEESYFDARVISYYAKMFQKFFRK